MTKFHGYEILQLFMFVKHIRLIKKSKKIASLQPNATLKQLYMKY